MREETQKQRNEHQECVELATLYVSGELSGDQLKSLEGHLEGCLECRRALREFQEIESVGMPALAPELAAGAYLDDLQLAPDRTTRRIFARIENEIYAQQSPGSFPPVPSPVRRLPSYAFRYSRLLLPYAAAILLTTSISIYSYHRGAEKVADVSGAKLRQMETEAGSLETQIAELSKDRAALSAKLDESDHNVTTLSEKIKRQLDQIALLEEQKRGLADRAQGVEAQRLASDIERDVLNGKLADAQASLASMQTRLDLARDQQSSEALRAESLEKRINDLVASLRDRDQTVRQQRELIDYDRDIRDLLSARDLYVAEVTDVGRDGETKTPFGRVFFTKEKSLIFYAYDLDKQPGVRLATVFQAWGRRGPDFEQALPLGILYLDDRSKKRWVLRFDDPKTLARIDAVFVTVEPRAGSTKPSSKPVLFAYLKVEANHP
jgi:anti-sigma factor RsiW